MTTYSGDVLGWQTPTALGRDFESTSQIYAVGSIAGTTKVQTAPLTQVPIRCMVYLVREQDHIPVRKVASDPITGAYSFADVPKHWTYTVLAGHPTLSYRAVLADGVFPT